MPGICWALHPRGAPHSDQPHIFLMGLDLQLCPVFGSKLKLTRAVKKGIGGGNAHHALAYITRGLCNFSVTLEIYKFSLVFLFHFASVLFYIFFLFSPRIPLLFCISFREREVALSQLDDVSLPKEGKWGGEKPEWSWEVCNVNKWIGRNQR